jgi:hypothetical protein
MFANFPMRMHYNETGCKKIARTRMPVFILAVYYCFLLGQADSVYSDYSVNFDDIIAQRPKKSDS